MLLKCTYKYKLYEAKQNKHLHNKIDIAGIIYNHCLALHRRYYKIYGKHLNQNKLKSHLSKLKKRFKYEPWNLVGSQAIQDIVERIDRSYKRFFRDIKKKRKTSPPKFKKVKKYSSFTLKQSGWKLLEDNKVKINDRIYKYSKSREIDGEIKTVTIKRDSLGQLWLCFSIQKEIEQPNRQGNISVGFDFGLKDFLVGSDGSRYDSPLYYKQYLKRLKRAQKELSRKEKGSRNREKARLKVARLYQKVVNSRRDYFFKLAHELTDNYDYIYLEDLSMKGMQRLWGRKVSDISHSFFLEILEHIAIQKGVKIKYINRYYPSSKLCHKCETPNEGLNLEDRTWQCSVCDSIHDRDLNAAINIEREGHRPLE